MEKCIQLLERIYILPTGIIEPIFRLCYYHDSLLQRGNIMLVLKMMSAENLSDSNVSKQFSLVACSNVSFQRDGQSAIAEIILADGTSESYSLSGNAYVMQSGKTIASFAHSKIQD